MLQFEVVRYEGELSVVNRFELNLQVVCSTTLYSNFVQGPWILVHVLAWCHLKSVEAQKTSIS